MNQHSVRDYLMQKRIAMFVVCYLVKNYIFPLVCPETWLYGTNIKIYTMCVFFRNTSSLNQSIDNPYPSVGKYCRMTLLYMMTKYLHVGYFHVKRMKNEVLHMSRIG